ncbi:phytochrome kinase substrate 4 [Hibiscus trionum]|uniref:Phytochrome kinase substrate 4 n=1 Tax=Hibiscus trionum TaxID=183268 RepID=A0A9W7MR23_HIBTR|nr:phytochrome kinase substrate 4 [Hibiscus trionum]
MMMENPRVMKTMNGVQVSADEDTEISIFDAKRYFNESNSDPRVCKRVSPLDIPNLVHVSSDHGAGGDDSALALAGRFSSASSAADGYGYGRTYRVRSFHATPTPSSEASWNSQTGLLSNPTGAIAVSMTTTDDNSKRSGKKRWLWRPCCPCSGKKSVQVEPKAPLSLNPKLKADDHKRQEIPVIQVTNSNPHSISENHEFHSSLGQRVVATTTTTTRVPLMISNGSATAAGFTFPILNQQLKPSRVEMTVNRNNSSALVIDHEDPPRESLDVFLPPDESSNSVPIPKKLVSRITVVEDDVASDTSSDLFEIESLSTTTKGQSTTSLPMYNRRDSLDEALHLNTIRSIPGASGFSLGCPYSPMATECYEPSEASIEWSVATAEGFERGSVGVSEAEENMLGIGNYNGGKKKSGDGGLLSCRSQKAVSVGPNPVKYVPPRGHAATTLKHVGNVNNPRLSRLSLPFSS